MTQNMEFVLEFLSSINLQGKSEAIGSEDFAYDNVTYSSTFPGQ